MSQQKYARCSLQALSDDLAQRGHSACPSTVAQLLRGMGYNLHVNVKRFTGPPHPDRNQQFEYIQERIAQFRVEGWPVISIDSKKKELIGNFKNGGTVIARKAIPNG